MEIEFMGDVTALIQAASSGNADALPALFQRVYAELKQIAHKQLVGAGSTLNTTGLVHEAYLKLARPESLSLDGRSHFFALAAKAMRQVVIDHARTRVTEKRGGENMRMVELDTATDAEPRGLDPGEMLRLDNALTQLEGEEPRLAQLVEMRYFAGLAIAEIARLRDVSERTLNRDWRRAKAHLYAALYPQ